jgi:hypothetical protein
MLTAASGPLHSDFHTASAIGFDALSGHGDINAYVKITDAVDGSHLLFSATGNVQTAGVDIMAIKFVHGLSVNSLYANGGILA